MVPFTVARRAAAALPPAPSAAKPGTIRVDVGSRCRQWPADHQVCGDGRRRKVEVTDGTQVKLTGLGDGQTVTVRVHAVNEAGDGPAATATARTVAEAAGDHHRHRRGYTSVTVNFTVDAGGGGTATCTATISGAATAKGSCSSSPSAV